MTEDLDELAKTLDTIVAGLSAGERRRATRAIATELRRSQAERIASQLNPDGTPFEPRKPRFVSHHKGVAARAARRRAANVARRAMFAKLRTSRFLKARSDADTIEVGFSGNAARIARVHQEGLRDKVDSRRSSADAIYPIRRILGLSSSDRAQILKAIVNLMGLSN
jgi:phage virion morphogenesis protein